ncbi:MAG: hypothetical protein ACLR0U_18680 [Enterocloster clostridioformis]
MFAGSLRPLIPTRPFTAAIPACNESPGRHEFRCGVEVENVLKGSVDAAAAG